MPGYLRGQHAWARIPARQLISASNNAAQELNVVLLDVGPQMHQYLEQAERALLNLVTSKVGAGPGWQALHAEPMLSLLEQPQCAMGGFDRSCKQLCSSGGGPLACLLAGRALAAGLFALATAHAPDQRAMQQQLLHSSHGGATHCLPCHAADLQALP